MTSPSQTTRRNAGADKSASARMKAETMSRHASTRSTRRRQPGTRGLAASTITPILRRPLTTGGHSMNSAAIDVVGIGNAIVDVIAHSEEPFLAAEGLAKGAMTLID